MFSQHGSESHVHKDNCVKNGYCSIVCNSKKMETTSVSINEGMIMEEKWTGYYSYQSR